MKILSLGWGVQSFALAAMSALGEIERIDYAIHSDTLHERAETYDFIDRYTKWLEFHDIKVIEVKNPTGGLFNIFERGQIQIPAFTSSVYGNSGQLMRSCTQRWKIAPMRKWIRDNCKCEHIEQWIGISTDEFIRMKPSDVKYIQNRWPLIELGMSRDDCKLWLKNHDLDIPPKSSCVFCPFHSFDEWRNIKSNSRDWNTAVLADNRIRNMREQHKLICYLHPSRIPLENIDFRSTEECGQMLLWDDECSGICGI